MKIGEETICYQHHQTEMLMESLLKAQQNTIYALAIKEAIDWVHKANDSAVRMENKLNWYRDNVKESGMI